MTSAVIASASFPTICGAVDCGVRLRATDPDGVTQSTEELLRMDPRPTAIIAGGNVGTVAVKEARGRTEALRGCLADLLVDERLVDHQAGQDQPVATPPLRIPES